MLTYLENLETKYSPEQVHDLIATLPGIDMTKVSDVQIKWIHQIIEHTQR